MWIAIFLCRYLKGSVDTMHRDISLTTRMLCFIFQAFFLAAVVFTSVLQIVSETFSNSMSIITTFTTNPFLAYTLIFLFRLLFRCAAVRIGIYLAVNILIFLDKVIKNGILFTNMTSTVNVTNLRRT